MATSSVEFSRENILAGISSLAIESIANEGETNFDCKITNIFFNSHPVKQLFSLKELNEAIQALIQKKNTVLSLKDLDPSTQTNKIYLLLMFRVNRIVNKSLECSAEVNSIKRATEDYEIGEVNTILNALGKIISENSLVGPNRPSSSSFPEIDLKNPDRIPAIPAGIFSREENSNVFVISSGNSANSISEEEPLIPPLKLYYQVIIQRELLMI